MELRWQDTREVIDELLLEIDALTKDREVKIELRNMAGDTNAWIDSARFMQVLRNLLSNAIKFSPAGSTIGIVARRDATGVDASVVDAAVDALADALVIEVID